MSDPVIIMSAPNGARRQKQDHPKIPITPDEMAECAAQILSAGSSILHLHVRDDRNLHSLDVNRYQKSIEAIHDMVGNDLIIQATTESVGIYTRYQQMEMVKNLKPEAVSLALRELCPTDYDINDFESFNKWMKSECIFPQYILYNEEDYYRFEKYRKIGIFQDDSPFVLFVFGSYHHKNSLSENHNEKMQKISSSTSFPWAVCGFDTNEKQCVQHAILNGGHIRVGFENNLWQDENIMLNDNAEMVCFSKEMAIHNNRSITTAHDVRNMFNIRD